MKECYNNCIKTALSDADCKSKEIKQLLHELDKYDTVQKEYEKQLISKDKTINELNKELSKLKQYKRDSDKKCEALEQFIDDLKKQKIK